MTRVNIWMKEELHKQLKIVAALKGVTIQEFIVNAIKVEVRQDTGLLREMLR